MSAQPIAAVEEVPDEDQISRACFSLPSVIDPESAFKFERDPQGERIESVFWRKYAVLISDVHGHGCQIEQQKNIRLGSQGKPLKKYCGATTAGVGPIRTILSGRGFRFSVVHCPESGNAAHSHIGIAAPPRLAKPNKNDMRELISKLAREFGKLEGHDCARPRND